MSKRGNIQKHDHELQKARFLAHHVFITYQ